jgi:hypothetical protein
MMVDRPMRKRRGALGTESNGIGCHQRAVWAEGGRAGDVQPVKRGSMSLEDPFFAGKLRTHLLWSLVFRPRPLPGAGTNNVLPQCQSGRLC